MWSRKMMRATKTLRTVSRPKRVFCASISGLMPRVLSVCLMGVVATCAACSEPEHAASSTFYDRKISPIVRGSCSKSPTLSSCHVAADDRGNALGNLNVDSFDTINLRRDLFIDYGPY